MSQPELQSSYSPAWRMNASRSSLRDDGAAGQHHQRAAGDQRVAVDERGRAVGGELGGAVPLQQRELHGHQRQPGEHRQPRRARELDQDHQRRPVEHVVGQDVPRLVAEHGADLELVEQVDAARVDHDHRLAGADRRGVRDRELGQVEVVALGQVEPRADRVPVGPDLRQLVLPQPHRGGEELLAQRALVAELDQLAHDHVEHRDRLQRGRRRAVGRVLVGLRGQVERGAGPRAGRSSWCIQTLAVFQPDDEPQPAPGLVDRADLVVDEPRRQRDLAQHVLGDVGLAPSRRAWATRSTARPRAPSSPAARAAAARARPGSVWKLTITSAVPPARRLTPDVLGQLAERLALEPVRRAEQRDAVARLDAELARQRRAAVSGGAGRWHGHEGYARRWRPAGCSG